MNQEERARELLSIGDYKFRQGKISRRQFMSLIASCGVVIATPGLLSACGGSNGASQTDRIRFLVGEAFWADWNPYGHTAQIGFKIQQNLFDRLVEIRPDLSLQPGLAKEWEQIDERTWEFKLRDGVKFHKGQTLTAQDVKTSIELASGFVKNEKTAAMAAHWIPHEVEVVDDLTVRLRGEQPYGPLLNTLAITDILSAEDLEKGVDAIAKAPNGTGAYRLADDKPNEKTLEAFKDYYRGPAGVQTVVWEYIQDSQTRLNALLAGQAAVIDRVEPDQASTIKQRDDVELKSITSLEIQSLWFRMDKEPFGDNAALRRAVAWGVDRQPLVDVIGGETELAVSHLASGILYHKPQEPQYTFDPERARAEMEAAGVSPPVAFELGTSTGFYPKSKEVSELAVENLNEVGFKVKLTVLELAAWIDMLFGESKPGELFHGGWGNLTRDPDFAVATLFHSPGAWTGAHDDRTDELIDRGKTTTGKAERGRVYGELQTYLWEQVPSVPLVYSEISNGVDANLSGFKLYPTFIHRFWPVEIQEA
jgi:peptide/nickel transport system substrate-binding protein